MVTGAELGEPGREVCGIARKEETMNAIERAIDLRGPGQRTCSRVPLWIATHQKRDVSVLEKICIMS